MEPIKRKANCICLLNNHTYIAAKDLDGMVESLDFVSETLTLDYDAILFFTRFLGIEPIQTTEDRIIDNKIKRIRVDKDLEFYRLFRDLEHRTTVEQLFVTVLGPQLCEIDAQCLFKRDGEEIERWSNRYTYSGNFIVSWNED